jgi:2-hydroxy-3-keto-5-methylthiopentenyl-1-phosphate phosphatase
MPAPPSPLPQHPSLGVAILVDYDGTIATSDVSDELIHATSSDERWRRLETLYKQGLIGSRALLEEEVRLLPGDPAMLPSLVHSPEHDQTFAPFARFAADSGIPLEIVSDGLGFFVPPAMARHGLAQIPVFSATVGFGPATPEIRFPYGNPTCDVCGTCKRDRVLHHQAAGRHVVFIGDGHSDRYAAWYADTVFAKGDLPAICMDLGRPYQPWEHFGDVQGWLTEALRRGRIDPPMPRRFICGAESTARDGS